MYKLEIRSEIFKTYMEYYRKPQNMHRRFTKMLDSGCPVHGKLCEIYFKMLGPMKNH